MGDNENLPQVNNMSQAEAVLQSENIPQSENVSQPTGVVSDNDTIPSNVLNVEVSAGSAPESNTSASPILNAGNAIEKPKKTITIPENVKTFFSNKKNIAIIAGSLAVVICGIVAAVLLLGNKTKTDAVSGSGEESGGISDNEVVKYYDNITGDVVSYSGKQYNSDGSEKENENGKAIVYSKMQAEQLADKNNQHRTNCVQISNNVASRPQVGLNEAKIVYETITASGETRFNAIYRDSSSNMVGPLAGLTNNNNEFASIYDCSLMFNSNADSEMTVKQYGTFSVEKGYAWQDNSAYYVEPLNIFTSAKKMDEYNNDNKHTLSKVESFARMTPDQSTAQLKKIRKEQNEPEEGESLKYIPVSNIYVHIGDLPQYNINYTYNSSTNSYSRAYESGEAHTVYSCKGIKKEGAEINPTRNCKEPVQVSPKVVIIMKANGGLASDSGEVWIFQNGIMLSGVWERGGSSLSFKDAEENEIKIAPGQTFVTVIPEAGGFVSF